jgi:transposase
LPPSDEHSCDWRAYALEVTSQLEALKAEMAALKRQVLGPKSEKMPPMEREVRKARPRDPATVQAKRRANAQLRATGVKTEDVHHRVRPEQHRCPKCGREDARPVGPGKVSYEWDWVPGYFRRRRHIRETVACPCGQHIVTAPGPEHAIEGTRYADGFRAAIVTGKCADSIPLYRQAKQLARLGIPISRSTLGDLFHQVARELRPLAARLLALVAESEVVLADETSMKMQQPNKRGF